MNNFSYLVHGELSAESIKKLSIPIKITERKRVLFLGFAEYTITCGAKFNMINIKGENLPIMATLEYITQQYNLPFDEIPLGWKTIVVIEVGKGIEHFSNIPIVETWYQSDLDIRIGFSNEE